MTEENPCQDCAQNCTEECLGHLTEEELDAWLDYLRMTYWETWPEVDLEKAIERWR